MIGRSHIIDTMRADHVLHVLKRVAQRLTELRRTRLGLFGSIRDRRIDQQEAIIAVASKSIATIWSESLLVTSYEIQGHRFERMTVW